MAETAVSAICYILNDRYNKLPKLGLRREELCNAERIDSEIKNATHWKVCDDNYFISQRGGWE